MSNTMEHVKHTLIALFCCAALAAIVVGISYFVWDYNVQLQVQETEVQKAYAEAMAERERTRQAWIKTVTNWEGNVLVVPERLIMEEEPPQFDPLAPHVPNQQR